MKFTFGQNLPLNGIPHDHLNESRELCNTKTQTGCTGISQSSIDNSNSGKS